jgi:type I restriction enzyme S subunit
MGDVNSSARIGNQNMERVSATHEEIERFGINDGNLIFARTSMMTGGLGNCSIVTKHSNPIIFDGNLLCAEIDIEIADPEFYFYFFKSKAGQYEIATRATGTQSRNIPGSKLMEANIPVLDKQEQNRIASILSRLDSKIELTRRMNETLQGIAKAIFKQWFVDFEFPTEQGKPYKSSGGRMMDSELGEIPIEWKIGELGEIAENPRRGISSSEIEHDTPYLGLEHMPRRSIALSEWGNASDVVSNKFQFRQGEILFGKLRPYFHKVGVAPVNGVCSTDILVLTPKSPEWYGLVLCCVTTNEFVKYTDVTSTGTKMPRTNWESMAHYTIVIPTNNVADAFSEKIAPLIQKIVVNILQTRRLVEIRDSILPKLMSGEIRVPIEVSP